MKKLKKYSLLLLIIALFMLVSDATPIIVNNTSDYCAVSSVMEEEFQIYNEKGERINTAQTCEVGDMFISADNILYEIVSVDKEKKVAYAIRKTTVTLPKVNNKIGAYTQIETNKKVICMYHTHNAESYVLGDGYDSVYGKGGVMDIGSAFLKELNKLGINVFRSENLHLPHDSYAYSRSKTTAQSLIKQYSPHAIFDVHRDGVARSQYIGSVFGKTTSKIRMVIGKSNPNFATNLDFALAIKAYADKNYSGLIKDIYMGSGHYNQNLSSTAILFEMGTYLIEKDYVISSLPYLADTIDKVMFTTAVQAPNEEESMGDIIAGSGSSNSNTNQSTGNSGNENTGNSGNENTGNSGSQTSGSANQNGSNSQIANTSKGSVSVLVSVIGISLGVIAIGVLFALFSQKRKIKKQ